MIPRPTLTLSLMLVAVAAAAVFGHDHVRPAAKNAAAKTVVSAQGSQPPAPSALIPPPGPLSPAASAPEAPLAPAPLAPSASAPEIPAAPAAAEPPRRMTAAEEASFDAWMMKTYLACWKPAASSADSDPYVARVRLAFRPDGSLMKPPKLVNPPSDPAQKPQAKSVMKAVKACDPLSVPAQYRPFYEQWKTKTLHFDPQIAAR